MPRPIALFLFLGALIGAPTAGSAEPESFRAQYSVTLLGIPIGKGSFDSTFSGKRFSITGSVASAGIARIFDRTNATTKVEGAVGRQSPLPRSFQLDYTSGSKTGHTALQFSGNRVQKIVNRPELPTRERWVPLTPAALQAAVDPLSSTLVRTDDPAKVCARTVRFFDGELRADLQFSHRDTKERNGEPVITCNVRFVPVAGYQQGRNQVDFLKNSSRISISFARLGNTGFYTPVEAAIGTQVGTVRVAATSIERR